MNLEALHPTVHADQVPLDRLSGNRQLTEQDKVKEVARQFEAVLLRQILTEARKGLHSGGLGEGRGTLGIYSDMINHTLADNISRNGMLGLARSLETQLTRQTAEDPSAKSDLQP